VRRGIRTRVVQRWLLVSPLLLVAACGGPQALGEADETCFRDDECVAGLICVAPEEGSIERVCSNDPTPIISNVEMPPVMEMPMGGAAGMAGTGGMAGDMAVAGGGMGAVAGGGAANAGSGGTDVGGTDTGGGGIGGNGGVAAAARSPRAARRTSTTRSLPLGAGEKSPRRQGAKSAKRDRGFSDRRRSPAFIHKLGVDGRWTREGLPNPKSLAALAPWRPWRFSIENCWFRVAPVIPSRRTSTDCASGRGSAPAGRRRQPRP